jgi:hypothetical protein
MPPEITRRNPFAIRFSQDSIRPEFKESPFGTIDDLAQGLHTGRIQPDAVEPIRLVEQEGILITLDNRRLQAFRQAGVEIPTRMATLEELPHAERTGKFSAGARGTETIKIRRR